MNNKFTRLLYVETFKFTFKNNIHYERPCRQVNYETRRDTEAVGYIIKYDMEALTTLSVST